MGCTTNAGLRPWSYLQGFEASDHVLGPRPPMARYEFRNGGHALTKETLEQRSGRGVWRWHELLPVLDPAAAFSLGEGETKIENDPVGASAYGLGALWFKREGSNPTGTFKDRGISVATSLALEAGAARVVVASSGNAARSMAYYGRHAGLSVLALLPADAAIDVVREIEAQGATVVTVDGHVDDCAALANRVAAETASYDVSGMREPGRIEGKKTMLFEAVEQLGWRAPDTLIFPTGGGTGVIAAWKALDELQRIGLIDGRRPRLIAVQAAGCAPLVHAFERGLADCERWRHPRTDALGLRVPFTPGGRRILSILRQSRGGAIAVPDAEIHAVAVRHSTGDGILGLETAACIAAIPAAQRQGAIRPGEEVMIFDTGGHARRRGQRHRQEADIHDVSRPDATRIAMEAWAQ